MKDKLNPTIASLDRAAMRFGIDLTRLGVNKREFFYTPTERVIRYQPGGKGCVKCTSYQDDKLVAMVTKTPERVEAMFDRVRQERNGVES